MGWMFSFDGRCARGGWLLAYLVAILLAITVVLYPVGIWVLFAVSAQRWHDLGASGWWSLISLIPLGGLVMFVMMAFVPGQDGDNQYGLYADRR